MQNLEKYSIYELRQIARSMGVKSPTTKKHSQLIDEIKKIQNKEIAPIKTTKGRPAKVLNNDFSNKVLRENEIIQQYKSDIKKHLEEIQKTLDKMKKIFL